MEEIVLKKQITSRAGDGLEVYRVPIWETLVGCFVEEG
jgi:hypothetical protein